MPRPFGFKHSEETKRKIKETNIKYFKEHPRILSEETKRKIGDSVKRYRKKHPVPEKTRKKLSEIKKGKTPNWKNGHPLKGKHHSEETRRKISEANKGMPNNHIESCTCYVCKAKRGEAIVWNKGLTRETDERVRRYADAKIDWDFYNKYGTIKKLYPYSDIFTEKFKKAIIKLYGNKCVITGMSNEEHKIKHGRSLAIHHWTYDKDETNPFYFVPISMEIHGN